MLSQLDLIASIFTMLEEYGIAPNHRQQNAVIQGATIIADALAKPDMLSTPNMGLAAWLYSDDTGTSSRYMAWALAPLIGYQGHVKVSDQQQSGYIFTPSDPADFGRCLRLIDAVPELRPHLGSLSRNHGPHWSALIAVWDELEALYRQESPSEQCPLLFKRMSELLDKAV